MVGFRQQVTHQLAGTLPISLRKHHRISDAFMAPQHRRHFLRLHTLTAHFHLVVEAAHEHQVAVFKVTAKVTRTIEPASAGKCRRLHEP